MDRNIFTTKIFDIIAPEIDISRGPIRPKHLAPLASYGGSTRFPLGITSPLSSHNGMSDENKKIITQRTSSLNRRTG
jgi:hypothetical protein